MQVRIHCTAPVTIMLLHADYDMPTVLPAATNTPMLRAGFEDIGNMAGACIAR